MLHPQQICPSRASRVVKLTRLITLTLFVSLIGFSAAKAQTSDSATTDRAMEKASLGTYPEKPPDDPFKARLIPRNSKIYIAPIKAEDPQRPQAQGFESYLAAALRKKNVPLLISADRVQAVFIIEGTAHQKGAGWAKKIILADFRKSTSASMTVTNLRTGVVAYAD